MIKNIQKWLEEKLNDAGIDHDLSIKYKEGIDYLHVSINDDDIALAFIEEDSEEEEIAQFNDYFEDEDIPVQYIINEEFKDISFIPGKNKPFYIHNYSQFGVMINGNGEYLLTGYQYGNVQNYEWYSLEDCSFNMKAGVKPPNIEKRLQESIAKHNDNNEDSQEHIAYINGKELSISFVKESYSDQDDKEVHNHLDDLVENPEKYNNYFAAFMMERYFYDYIGAQYDLVKLHEKIRSHMNTIGAVLHPSINDVYRVCEFLRKEKYIKKNKTDNHTLTYTVIDDNISDDFLESILLEESVITENTVLDYDRDSDNDYEHEDEHEEDREEEYLPLDLEPPF